MIANRLNAIITLMALTQAGTLGHASGSCLQDVANTPPNAMGPLSCNANDVSLATATNVSIIQNECTADRSGTLTFQATFEIVSNATTRYDVGIYFATDGDPNGNG